MNFRLRIALCLLLAGLAAHSAYSQQFVGELDRAEAAQILDRAPAKSHVPCYIEMPFKPSLDFLFRYAAVFYLQCRLGIVVYPGTTWYAVIRITNQLGQSRLMLEEFDIPKIAPNRQTLLDGPIADLQASMSGGFALGPGRYQVEIVLTDEHGNTMRKQWKLKLNEYKQEERIPTALPAGAIAPLIDARWDGALTANGLRVTVLLHAYSPSLHARIDAGARAYVLESLASLLSQLPCKSVRLVAFNIDRQQVVYQQDNFDAPGFKRLADTLKQLEFATIPYQSLRRYAWAEFLAGLTRQEIAPEQPSDVVIFLGPWGSHTGEEFPDYLFEELAGNKKHVFYLMDSIPDFSDAISKVAKAMHGSTYTIYSPQTLERAIQKMTAQIAIAPVTPGAQSASLESATLKTP